MDFDLRLNDGDYDKAPDLVKGLTQLPDDLQALYVLTETANPPPQLLQGTAVNHTLFGFVDTSGVGFGSTFVTKNNKGINYRIGVWGSVMQNKSSNLREFRNAVDAVEHEGKYG
eukprot:7017845-Ditylum_brightwellii.AAC.1